MADVNEPIRWLHVSDLHMGYDKPGQSVLFYDLLEHIEDYIKQAQAYPDMVFITGDIANAGKAEEYIYFYEAFFRDLVAIVKNGHQSPYIFMIPGNHDVQRGEMDKLWLRDFYTSYPHVLDQQLHGDEIKRRNRLIERFQGYIEAKEIHELASVSANWLKELEGSYTFFPELGDKLHGKKLGILGLNTAWLSGEGKNREDTDRHKLTPGELIVAVGLNKLKREHCDIQIVLGHHKVDWFIEKEANAIRSRFARNGVIYLHGDQHENKVGYVDQGSERRFLTIEAGAAFQGRNDEVWLNRLLWCELYPEEQVIHIHPRMWSVERTEWQLDSSLPEGYRVPGTDYWEYELPNAEKKPKWNRKGGETANRNVDWSKPPFDGWKLMSAGYLESRSNKLTDDQALRYFNGTSMGWEIALSQKIPRRKIVEELKQTVLMPRADSPDITVLWGGTGEGKSTILLQTASDILTEQSSWMMLYQESYGKPWPDSFWNETPFTTGDWLVVVDEAGSLIKDIFDASRRIPPERSQHFHFLLCCRDADWRSERADTLPWKAGSLKKVPERRPLGGIEIDDARAIVEKWKACKEDGSGLGTLQGLEEEEAAQELVKMATSEVAQKDGEGAFLGALFQARFGSEENLQNHVLGLLNRLREKYLEKPHEDITLFDAFASIAAAHMANIQVLTEDILAASLGIDPVREGKYIDNQVIYSLGQEVGLSLHGAMNQGGTDFRRKRGIRTVLTRHKRIAEATVKILSNKYNEKPSDWEDRFETLLKNALYVNKQVSYVPMFHIWRQLPMHFADKRGEELFFLDDEGQIDAEARMDFALYLARLLVEDDNVDPLYITQLADIQILDQDFEGAVTTLRNGTKNILKMEKNSVRGKVIDVLYYHDWAAIEGKAAWALRKATYFALSSWLNGLALDKSTPKPSRKDAYTPDGYAKMFLNSLSIDFKPLKEFFPARAHIFYNAWKASVLMGWQLEGNFMTVDTHRKLEQSRAELGSTGKMDISVELVHLHEGIKASWEVVMADEALNDILALPGMKKPDELSFEYLKEMLHQK